jgi:hypothetical protein
VEAGAVDVDAEATYTEQLVQKQEPEPLLRRLEH